MTAILLLISCLYFAVATHLNHHGTFWSPDSNVRFEMVRSWAAGGSPIFLTYPGQEFDPTNSINPIGHTFAIRVSKGLCGIYNPVFVVACGVFYRLFGFGGLTVLPMLAGLITIFVTYASARLLNLRFRLPMTLLLGIASPLLIYSTIFWDHSLQIMLAALACYFVLCYLKNQRLVFCLLASALLGFGVWVHPLQGVLFAAMGIALIAVQRKNTGKAAFVALLGFLPFIIALAAWNQATYGALGGAHAVGTLRNLESGSPTGSFDLAKLWQRAQLELLGVDDSSLAMVLIRVYIACYLLSLFTSKPIRRWAAPILCFGAAEILWKTIGETPWANGLFQGTPLLLPALAAPFLRPNPTDRISSYRQICCRWMALTAALFAVGVFLSPGFIGLNWGSRFLLTALPLLALLSAYALEAHFAEAEGRSRWAVLFLCTTLIATSIHSQFKGFELVSGHMDIYEKTVQDIETLDSPVLVSDAWQFSIQTLVAKRPRLRYLISGKPEDQARLFEALRRADTHEFTFIGSDYGAARTAERAGRQAPHPFVPIKVNRTLGFVQVEFKEKR
ncbi:MAG: glycosyltransferase family 39 protein [Cytophagales bacterium]|nr:glycosyltransferase family 39 protein [Armatimonadota bacterium]